MAAPLISARADRAVLAHGFSIELMVELVRGRLARATVERVVRRAMPEKGRW
jgi:hypothetical protein